MILCFVVLMYLNFGCRCFGGGVLFAVCFCVGGCAVWSWCLDGSCLVCVVLGMFACCVGGFVY